MITVQTSHDSCELFRKKKISDYCVDKIGIDRHDSDLIALAVWRKLRVLDESQTITTSMIREEVNAQLRKRGYIDESRQHERVGVPFEEIKEFIRGHNSDNANLQRNPETFHKHVADAALKQFALECLPKELAEAHNKGELHIHDLEYFPGRPVNCLQHDLRWFIREPFKPDGSGEHTSVAKPAKHPGTLMNHAGEILLAGQQNCSGGQGFSLFNVFIAPFFKGLDYKEIKQNIQMLVYNLNMAYSNRGGQVPFTSINLEFTVPDFIKDEIAWGPKGEPVGVYGDYEKEVRLLSNAFAEVLREGDAMGKPHLFPNTIWVLREEMMTEEFDDALELVHEVSAKYSTPYFVSCIPEWTGGHSNVMGCRTRLNTNWTGNWDTDTLRTGNLAYITINFPRIAYKSNGNFKDFFDELERVLKLAKDILLIRRHHALKLLNEYNMLPFLAQKNKEGEKYYRIENATLSFGIIGMDEMAKAFHNDLGKGIESKEGSGFIATVLAYINEVVKSLQEETGLRWTVLQTPGETTAHRFATLDKKHFPEQSIANGEEGAYYYTNSTHVPVDSKLLLPEKIKIESQFHPFTAGGHIFHVWLGESPNAKALLSLTKKIATRSQIGFWAYTGAFSFCFGCNTFIKGIQTECHSCGEEQFIEHYSRITGYMQQVGYKMDATGGWNPGKRQELKDRYEHEL